MDEDSFWKKVAGGVTIVAHISMLNAATVKKEQEFLGLGDTIWSAVSSEGCRAPDCTVDAFTLHRIRVEVGVSSLSATFVALGLETLLDLSKMFLRRS